MCASTSSACDLYWPIQVCFTLDCVALQTTDFYTDVPPAPPGLVWWHYRDNVPALAQPATYFGLANWTSWGWRYDPDYTVPFYQYSNLDKVH